MATLEAFWEAIANQVNFREAQAQALNLDLVGMIPTIDIGDDYNVHPRSLEQLYDFV